MSSSAPAIGDMSCIVIEGPDARRFAQAQFSGDVDTLAPGHWQWNAWLTPQGRIRALMHLADAGDGALLAILRGGDAEAIRVSLARYLLRMRTTLIVRTLTGHAGGPIPVGDASIDTDQSVVLGYGARSLRLAPVPAPPDPDTRAAWRLEDIRQGWANLPEGAPGFLPPALGLEHLGAVAFGKGCYPGQEIAARLHYRGGHKYRLCHLRGPGALPLGPIVDETGMESVWVLDAIRDSDGVEALAVVPKNNIININILQNIYSIESRFDM